MSGSGSEDNPHVHVFRPANAWQRRLFSATAIALLCAMAVAACGGSSKPKAGRASKARAAFVAFSECMRAHGVSKFPDPGASGGINLDGTGINPASPAFRAAQTTCFHLMPGGGPANQKPTKQQLDQEVAMSQCMRQHGVTGFPDPFVHTGAPPNLNPGEYSAIEDRGGVIIAIPRSIDTSSPAFRQASQTCRFH